MATGITPAESEGESEDGSSGSEEVIPVYRSVTKRRFKIFTKENTGKKTYGGWSDEGIDKMARTMKEIRVDRGEDPENEGMETSGSVRNKYWNFENSYFEWENEYVGGYIANRKRKGQEEVKDRRDGEISSLVSYKRRIMKKRQKKN